MYFMAGKLSGRQILGVWMHRRLSCCQIELVERGKEEGRKEGRKAACRQMKEAVLEIRNGYNTIDKLISRGFPRDMAENAIEIAGQFGF